MSFFDPLQIFTSSSENLISIRANLSKSKEIVWKAIILTAGVFFLLCGIVQHNDPDFHVWWPVYIIPSFLSFTIAFQMHFILLPQTVGEISRIKIGTFFWKFLIHMDKIIVCHMIYCLGLGIYMLTNLFTAENKIASPLSSGTMKDEEVKELFGLCIVLAWLSLLKDFRFLRLGNTGIIVGSMLTFLPILSWIYLGAIEGSMAPCK